MQNSAAKLIDRINSAEKWLAVIAFVIMLGAIGADVIGRELLSQGIFGSVRVAVYALILCAMAGFGIATATGSHLRPRFADRLVPAPLQPSALRLGQVISAAILLVLAWAAWEMVAFTRLIEERDIALDTLVWPVQLTLPVAFALSALRHLFYATFPALMPEEQEVSE